ncbi:MAG: TolC family protein, partial [Pirellulales bacterium]
SAAEPASELQVVQAGGDWRDGLAAGSHSAARVQFVLDAPRAAESQAGNDPTDDRPSARRTPGAEARTATPESLPLPRPAAAFQGETFPIDLANALALAGANNLRIRLARERVVEAQVNLDQARLLWIPSLRAAVGYNKHDGRLQATEGEVIEAGRNSLFVGGGAGLGTHPLNGAAGGPARLFVDLALADAAFEPLVARQLVRAQAAARTTDVNDTLLAVATAYFDVVEADGLLANAESGVAAAREMSEITGSFFREGRGARSEFDRANAELAFWRQAAADSLRQVRARSAELARLLRLAPGVVLVPAEERAVPIELVNEQMPLDALLAQGFTSRPELAQQQALVRAALERLDQERWRPWLPHLAVGASAGSFGGGPSGQFDNQGSRSDLDAIAAWELRNLGFGNGVLRRQRASQMRQARFETSLARDLVAAEIVTASSDVGSYREQFDIALENVAAASEALRLTLGRIRQG